MKVAIATTVIGSLLVMGAVKAVNQVVLRPEYDSHIVNERIELERHIVNEGTKLDALLTLQCRESPDDTICRDYR